MLLTVVTPTHDPKYLPEIWACLEAQTFQHRWEWLIAPTLDKAAEVRSMPFYKSPRVRVVPYPGLLGNVGAAKLWAFSRAAELNREGALLELDHDDLLTPDALAEVHDAFTMHPEVGFVYSDSFDWSPTGQPVTYHSPAVYTAWIQEGWKFAAWEPTREPIGNSREDVFGYPRRYPIGWEPSAKSLASILYAPNHLRAWRSEEYLAIGGHDPSRKVCDDHDLVVRTYLVTRMHRIPKVLYAYRVDGANTWLQHVATIQQASADIGNDRLHVLVIREMELRGLRCLDLGGGIDRAPMPWQPVDEKWEGFGMPGDGHTVDLRRHPWPFDDSSVGAFRAFDLLEHLPDKLGTMREIYRCLAPGGWLLSRTPSCAGPGAYRDPTHCSFWVGDSFRYHTETALARYLPPARYGENPRFMVQRLYETQEEIPYIVADLVSLKGDDGSLPGRRGI